MVGSDKEPTKQPAADEAHAHQPANPSTDATNAEGRPHSDGLWASIKDIAKALNAKLLKQPADDEAHARRPPNPSLDATNAEGRSHSDDLWAPINDTTKTLAAKLSGATELAEVEKILTLIKARSEIRKFDAEAEKAEADKAKVNLDSSLAQGQMRHALLGSMFAPLVPLASLLTVVVTLVVSSMQTHSSNELALAKIAEDKAAREETNWNAFAADVDKTPPDKLYTSGAFMARFHKFAASNIYKTQIADIAKQFMIGVSSNGAFREMWKLQVKTTTHENIDLVVELAKAKKQQFDRIPVECKQIGVPTNSLPEDPQFTYLGACSPKYSVDDLSKAISDHIKLKELLVLKDQANNLTATMSFLATEIAEYLRSRPDKDTPLDLSNLYLHSVDLSNVDFTKIDLLQSVVTVSVLKGAVLTPKNLPYSLSGSTWWDAAAIEQKMLLPWLITNAYPEQLTTFYPVGYKISKEQYIANVTRLCTANMKICSPTCQGFGTERPPQTPECK
jgi:hypothetical protein